MKFYVDIKEVHSVTVEIDPVKFLGGQEDGKPFFADPAKPTREELEKVAEHLHENSDNLAMEYSYTLDADDWTVRNEDGTFIVLD